MDFFPCPCFPLLFSFPKLTHLEVHPPAQSPMASLWGSIPICISSLHHLCARGLRVGGRGLLGEYKYVTMSGGGATFSLRKFRTKTDLWGTPGLQIT